MAEFGMVGIFFTKIFLISIMRCTDEPYLNRPLSY
jgi:hypothetical protein